MIYTRLVYVFDLCHMRRKASMKQERNHILKMWALVLQVGITAIGPIVLCVGVGIWLKNSYDVDWMLALCIIGILSGFSAAFRMAYTYAGKDDEATQIITGMYDKNKGYKAETEADNLEDELKAEYERLNEQREEF